MDGTTSRLVARARERLDAGDAYGAIHFLKEALATGKAFADAHNLLGLATAAVGQREEALAEFDRATLGDLSKRLEMLERNVSYDRRALHVVIDRLQAEIVERYKSGRASVDGLLS